jgi:hypothetical protein
MLLERRCRVCAWSVAGCPGCWRPAGNMRGYSKHSADKSYHREGGKNEAHGAKGSFAPSAISHTHLVDREAVEIHRRSQCYVNVFVKTVPAGEVRKLRLEIADTVAYLLFQFRMQAGESGLDGALVRGQWRCGVGSGRGGSGKRGNGVARRWGRGGAGEGLSSWACI